MIKLICFISLTHSHTSNRFTANALIKRNLSTLFMIISVGFWLPQRGIPFEFTLSNVSGKSFSVKTIWKGSFG